MVGAGLDFDETAVRRRWKRLGVLLSIWTRIGAHRIERPTFACLAFSFLMLAINAVGRSWLIHRLPSLLPSSLELLVSCTLSIVILRRNIHIDDNNYPTKL